MMSEKLKLYWLSALAGKSWEPLGIVGKINTHMAIVGGGGNGNPFAIKGTALGIACQISYRLLSNGYWTIREEVEPGYRYGVFTYPSGDMISESRGFVLPESMSALKRIPLAVQKQINMLELDMHQPWSVIHEFIRSCGEL